MSVNMNETRNWGRPALGSEPLTCQLTIVLSQSQAQWLRGRRESTGLSLNAQLRSALDDYQTKEDAARCGND